MLAAQSALLGRGNAQWPVSIPPRQEHGAAHARGLGAQQGANWKHGHYSRQAIEDRRQARRELRALIRLIREIDRPA